MNRSLARGMSLIEVMVSTVVLTLGSLSMASLQMTSSYHLRDAAARVEAVHLGHSFLERLRLNSSPLALSAYVAGGALLGGGVTGDMPSPNCYRAAATCTPQELARFDLWLWEQLLDGVSEEISEGVNAGLLNPTACLMAPPAAPGAPGTAGTYTLAIAYRSLTELGYRPEVDCGLGASFADGTPLYGDHDEFRQVVLVQAYIVPQVAK